MVKVHNDGKGKHNSFEAWSDLCHGHGYGQTEAEAIEEYKAIVAKKIEELQGLDFSTTIPVDWRGDPIGQKQ